MVVWMSEEGRNLIEVGVVEIDIAEEASGEDGIFGETAIKRMGC